MLRQEFQEALHFPGELPESEGRVVLELGFVLPGALPHEGRQAHAVPVLEQPRHGLPGKPGPALLLQDLLRVFLSSLEWNHTDLRLLHCQALEMYT